MKKLLLLLAIVILMPGCATIAHKDISTRWQGLGVDLVYQSRVAVPPDLIPEFIDAVNRLEELLKEKNDG